MDIGLECAKWNAARYEQDLDVGLAHNLLTEEVAELFTATSLVEKLDACGDIAFVAMGILWKAGVTAEELQRVVSYYPIACENVEDRLEQQTEAMNYLRDISQIEFSCEEEIAIAFYAITCLYQVIPTFLYAVGLLHEYKYIIEAICKSNNTKEVKGIVASNIKANVVKGNSYVPPTADLIAIIERNVQ